MVDSELACLSGPQPRVRQFGINHLFVPKAPGSKEPERQVRLYRPQCVAETMAADGAEGFPMVASATKAPEGRRLTQELHQLIHDLEGRGCALAQTLDVEPARVQRMPPEPIAA